MKMKPTRRRFLRDGATAVAAAGFTTALFARSEDSDLEELKRRLPGKVWLPGSGPYENAAFTSNGRYHHIRPRAVVTVADESDIVTCVRWSVETGCRPVVRGGGHSYAGFSNTKELMVDIRALNDVKVIGGVAKVGGAALNRDIFAATVGSDHILPGGTCLGVGVGGLVLGGGIGYNTHWAGLTCDHLTRSRIVTAKGEAYDIDKDHHEDLFWACRGGAGGSLGVNTSFTFELSPVPADYVGFYHFEWDGADAAEEVLAAYDKLLANAPAEFNAVAMAEALPLAGRSPREAIRTMSRGHFVGPMSGLMDVIAPLIALNPDERTLEVMPFWSMQAHWVSEETKNHSYGDISRYAAAPLPDKVVSDFVSRLAECPHRSDEANGSMWSLGWIGGPVVDSFGPADTAYVHRNMHTLWRPTIVWPNGEDAVGDDLQDWADAMIGIIADHTTTESYQNFPNRSLEDWKNAYYGGNLGRLVEVKAEHDPGDLFRNPQSIPTRL